MPRLIYIMATAQDKFNEALRNQFSDDELRKAQDAMTEIAKKDPTIKNTQDMRQL